MLMMELMMTHTVKRSMAMPGLAVRPLPLTYGNRPACPDLLPAGSAPATPLLFGRGGREGRRDGTAGTGAAGREEIDTRAAAGMCNTAERAAPNSGRGRQVPPEGDGQSAAESWPAASGIISLHQ